MMYVSVKAFEAYSGDEAETIEKKLGDSFEAMLAECEQRMLAYILPNCPGTEYQQTVFTKAVCSQFAWENRKSNAELSDVPDGVKSIKLGQYSVTLDGSSRIALSRRTMSPAAYAFLLNCGLLSRGMG